jgi:iron complex outermembrane recepter protein
VKKAPYRTAMFLAACTPLAALPAPADTAESQADVANSSRAATVEEIVVTATKSGEKLTQNVPLSISAYSADRLEALGIQSVQDLGTTTPGLSISNNSAYSRIYMRGVGSNLDFIGSDPSTTVHLDEVYLARPLMTFLDFVGIERVEVLRGPQGTLYGRNSAGGTINIVTKKPDNEFHSKLSTEYGRFGRLKLAGGLSGPLVEDRVMGSIAALDVRADGYVHNIYPQAVQPWLNDERTQALRGQLRFLPSDATELLLSADYTRREDTQNSYKSLGVTALGTPAPVPAFIPADPWQVNIGGDAPQYNKIENWGVASHFTWQISPEVGFTSISAYRTLDSDLATDSDQTEVLSVTLPQQDEDQWQLTQELRLNARLAAVDLVAGLFYMHEDASSYWFIGIPSFGFDSVQAGSVSTDAYSAFGQGEIHLSDKLTATLGARYNYETKSIDALASAFVGNTTVEIPAFRFAQVDEQSWRSATPKIGLAYQASDDLLLYASMARGFKSGGFNLFGGPAQKSYDPEYLWSYEAGIKSDWWDRRLRANVGAFLYDYTDLQLQSFVVVSGNQALTSVTSNVANATVKGAELELTAVPLVGLTVNLGLAWLDATYEHYALPRDTTTVPAVLTDLSGNTLNSSPKWSYTVGAQYEIGTAHGQYSFNADWRWQDRVYYSPFNDDRVGQGAYGLVNAQVAFKTSDERWTVAAFGRNLGNKAYFSGVNDFSVTGITAKIEPPRTWGVRLSYSY